MDIKDKAAVYDTIVGIIGKDVHKENEMKCIGTLTKRQGIKGFKPMEEGDFVFELGDRYILVMETLDGKNSAQVPYYKNTLAPHINFI